MLVLDGAVFFHQESDPRNNEVTAEFYIDSAESKPNFIYMREYQSLIFLLDKNAGVVIYNTVGKKINQLKTRRQQFWLLWRGTLLSSRRKVVFCDLYTEKTRLVEVGAGRFVLGFG